MEMMSIRLYLALTLFAAACTPSAAISPGCTSNIEILKNDSVAQQLESYLKNNMDIIEIHVKTKTCIALTNEDNTISNKTFASASTIEKYNMFIYFIVTDMGRAIMKYPADADTLSFGVLGSQKVRINVDVMLDNDCALNTEQFRTMSLKALSALAQIRSIRDISVCYYKVLEYSCWYYLLLSVLPYYTYNTFNTFCLTDGVTTELPQAITNKLLYWLCIVLHLTLPVGFFFIPHSVHEETDSYRKCDVPFSVSALLSYITYWKPSSKCCCCNSIKVNSKPRKQSFVQCYPDSVIDSKYCFCNYEKICGIFRPVACCGCCNANKNMTSNVCKKTESKRKCSHINLLWNKHIERLFIFITLSFFAAGLIIHYLLNRKTNVLENELMIYSFSSAFSYTHMMDQTFPIPLMLAVTLFLTVCFWAVCRACKIRVPKENEKTTEISYPIYIVLFKKNYCCKGLPCNCDNVFVLKLKTDRADLISTIKLVSEVICNATFWCDLLKASLLIFTICNAPLVLICCIPYINNCISSIVEDYKTVSRECTCKLLWIICYHVCKLLFTIVAINTMLIQTTTLVLQVIVLTLFVGIPVYPKLIAYIILLTGLIKYIMQAFLRFQSKSKHVLDEMFNSDEYKDKEEIPKTSFATVLSQCSSVNVCVLCMKIVAIVFVWFTAFVAIKHGQKDLSVWKDVIPSLLLFIGPDWLSKFIYIEEADNQFIDQCVERAITEIKQTTAQQNEEGLTTNLSGENPTVRPGTPNKDEQTTAQQNEEGLTTNLSDENPTVSPDTPDEEKNEHTIMIEGDDYELKPISM